MTILVGYTRTPEGHAALRRGVETAGSTGKPLAIFPLSDRAEGAAGDASLEAALGAGARLLERDPQGRHPAEELIDTAQEAGAELVVIGVRNRSRVSKILLGSDAQSIILGSPVPVLTVKAATDER
ncbi:universal stress protein [Arthrobacter sp. USHLN218]|uniref:universal stress protein n=1 Tax=Arthrobacter sp. USHLN218 TaxID=3081232 RepID=UPI00301B2598